MRLFPNRRWLRFSVRTLLITVTIFCVWLGWQVSIVRERHVLLQLTEKMDGTYKPLTDEYFGYGYNPQRQVSRFRQLIGDVGVDVVFLNDRVASVDRARVISAFPEADIWFFDGDVWQPIRKGAHANNSPWIRWPK